MLPFDRKPWAKTVAGMVIALSFLGAAGLTYYFYSEGSLHVSEIVGIFLLLLTIVPPNMAIVVRKPGEADPVNAHLRADEMYHSRHVVR